MDHGHALHLARANQDMFLANLQVKKTRGRPARSFHVRETPLQIAVVLSRHREFFLHF